MPTTDEAIPGAYDFSDLAGTAELADDLGVSRQTISNWAAGRARSGFPEPLVRLRATPVWSRRACRAWYSGQAHD